MPYQRIMAAVDGSETSDLALTEALRLTKALQAELCIIYVVDEFPIYNLGIGTDFDRIREIIRHDGLFVLDKAKETALKEGVRAKTSLIEIIDTHKKTAEKIVEAANEWKADLLVIGTHGRTGFNRILLGSVAEETLRISPIPILLIRAKEMMSK